MLQKKKYLECITPQSQLGYETTYGKGWIRQHYFFHSLYVWVYDLCMSCCPPVELSRVRLPTQPGVEGSDYITASYLQVM